MYKFEDAMPARRRRVGSEHEYDPMITTSNSGFQNSNFGHQYYNDGFGSATLDFDNKQQETNLVTMTSRDRTKEFANAIRTMQGRTVARAAVMRDPRHARQIQSYSNFMMIARNIGKNIASTYAKLEKLALCKKLNIRQTFDHVFTFTSSIMQMIYYISINLLHLKHSLCFFLFLFFFL